MSADVESTPKKAGCAGKADDAESSEVTNILMCDACYNSAGQIESADSEAKCDVCDLRNQLAECQQQVADKEARIAELEAQVSSSQVEPRIEEAPEPDPRAHLMAISDGMFTKMRKYPHTMFVQLGRVPRSFWRSKAVDGVNGMSEHLLLGLNNDRVEGRGFHVLWFGGLADTTLENYERSAFVAKLQQLLEKICEHEKCLSVTWATLPETAFNAEAREINERMAAWVLDKSDIRLLDLRYISRREGTMETNEAMWTPKGGQLIGESLKKFLIEKLELTEVEQKAMESSAKEMQMLREKRAKKLMQQDEQLLRKQQKLARAALLKAGHPVPGAGPRPFGRRNPPPVGKPTPFIRTAPPPKKFLPPGANGHKFAGGPIGPGGFKGKYGVHPKPYPDRAPAEYEAASSSGYDRLPASSSRVDPECLEDQRWRSTKRTRLSDTLYDNYDRYVPSNRVDHRGAGYGEVGLYSRRDDPYRRSPPRAHATDLASSLMTAQGSSAAYDRPYGAGGLADDMRRQQWATYDRLPRH